MDDDEIKYDLYTQLLANACRDPRSNYNTFDSFDNPSYTWEAYEEYCIIANQKHLVPKVRLRRTRQRIFAVAFFHTGNNELSELLTHLAYCAAFCPFFHDKSSDVLDIISTHRQCRTIYGKVLRAARLIKYSVRDMTDPMISDEEFAIIVKDAF